MTDSPPGSVYRFSSEHLAGSTNIFSQHQVGLARIIDMMKIMGHEPLIEIIGIVPDDIRSDDIGLSPAVESSIDKTALLVIETVSNTIHGGL
jgi:hydrogenase maturation protease